LLPWHAKILSGSRFFIAKNTGNVTRCVNTWLSDLYFIHSCKKKLRNNLWQLNKNHLFNYIESLTFLKLASKSLRRFISAVTRKRRCMKANWMHIYVLVNDDPDEWCPCKHVRRGLSSRRYAESINKCAFAGIEICIAQITGADYALAERIYVNTRI